jgi:malate dehydrogenase (oxaloacetate-decarboxylating)
MNLHAFYRGKIAIENNFSDISRMKRLFTPENLKRILTEDNAPSKTRRLCIIVTDGTAILGLGNIGSRAGLPVMEGKCVLFKLLGNVDVMPICINKR